MFTVAAFLKEINSEGSFPIPNDCQHDLLYQALGM